MRRTVIFSLVASLLLLGGWAVALAAAPTSSTVTVNQTSDVSDLNAGDGVCDVSVNVGDQCTLRAAIEELNAQGPAATPHHIEFNISGSGPFTITPGSTLPAIAVPVEIDGETQPGAACPTANAPAELLIVLDGSNAGTDVTGLVLGFGSDGSAIRGLVIGNFDSSGIRIESNNSSIRCNHIGLGVDGFSNMGNNFWGITVTGDSNTIGGQLSPAQRNVISANGPYGGIYIGGGADGNHVANNFVGTTADGMSALGNDAAGILVSGEVNEIGSDVATARDVIGGNGDGIVVNPGDNNVIRGNYIGIARDGITPLPNLGNGVELAEEAIANIIGGTAAGEANVIAHNVSHGITLVEVSGFAPVQNEIRGNAIYNNAGLGIDLGDDGVDNNDPGDGDGGENEGQNYPVLLAATGSLVITGTLHSQPNTQYTIDFYRSNNCDPSGYGEGQEHLAGGTATTNGSGQVNFVANPAVSVALGDSITATATDPNGNTSEFSACVTVEAPPAASSWVYLPIVLR
ncbi:MAG: hypothetical protein L0332_18805 [Chloroflexi bacterium]|nr:hypothetical protein [Chloroflexota bacterium]MCI0578536.1 hypothetical protein [Chloroflexota bacterium]MCI0647468.1 hypothetical protein [Chloroflexota bacterium]MCI0728748.1 hypothetical protein [Chloroflexota bacterium]